MSLWFKSARLARGVAALLLGMGAGLMDLPVAAQEKSQSPALSTEATKSITGGETLTLNPKTVERIQSLETQRFEAVQPGPMPKATPMTPATTVTAKDWYPNVLSGQHLALQGQTALADEKYKTALKAAATPLERSQTLLSWAESYSRAARQADVAADYLQRSAEIYREALPELEGSHRLVGYNNLGTVFLRLDEPAQALETLTAIEGDMENAEPASKARYRYNLGRAREKSGEPALALAHYREAATLDPNYKPAARATTRMLLGAPPNEARIAETADWFESLIAAGRAADSAPGLRQALETPAWAANPMAGRLLVTLLKQVTAERRDAAGFDAVWAPALAAARGNGLNNGEAVEGEIENSYKDDLPVIFSTPDGEPPALFAFWWQQEAGLVAADFAKMVGDELYAQGEGEKALSRYAAAWTLDNGNVEAALAAASLLLEQGADLDPNKELLNAFIEVLFERKGEAYLGEDWEAILRFHTILGNIYERLGIWGPEGNVRSALFQWSRALAAHENLMQSDLERVPYVPVLRAKVGQALEKENQPGLAFATYLAAAEDALNLNNARLARAYLDSADELSEAAQPSERQRRQLERLRQSQ